MLRAARSGLNASTLRLCWIRLPFLLHLAHIDYEMTFIKHVVLCLLALQLVAALPAVFKKRTDVDLTALEEALAFGLGDDLLMDSADSTRMLTSHMLDLILESEFLSGSDSDEDENYTFPPTPLTDLELLELGNAVAIEDRLATLEVARADPLTGGVYLAETRQAERAALIALELERAEPPSPTSPFDIIAGEDSALTETLKDEQELEAEKYLLMSFEEIGQEIDAMIAQD